MIETYIPERVEHSFRDSSRTDYQDRDQYNLFEGNPRGTVYIRNYLDGTGNHYYDSFGNELSLTPSNSSIRSYTKPSPISFSIPEEMINNSSELSLSEDFPVVRINDQVWMTKNLNIADSGRGISYNHEIGELFYDWEAATRICKKIKGWHLPTREEVDKLLSYCKENLKDKLGIAAFCGFTEFGTHYNHHSQAYFWLSDESADNVHYAASLEVIFNGRVNIPFNMKHYGYSIRCIRD